MLTAARPHADARTLDARLAGTAVGPGDEGVCGSGSRSGWVMGRRSTRNAPCGFTEHRADAGGSRERAERSLPCVAPSS